LGSGVKLYRSGKNLFNQASYGDYSYEGLTIEYLSDEDCFWFDGQIDPSKAALGREVMFSPYVLGTEGTDYTLSVKCISSAESIDYFEGTSGRFVDVTLYTSNEPPTSIGVSHSAFLEIPRANNSVVKLSGKLDGKKYFWGFRFYITKGVKFKDYKIQIQLEEGNNTATDFESFVAPTECVVNTDGTANVPSLYPSTRLYTDTEGVTIDAEYNRDVNKAFAELTNALISLGGNV
jgi:hypothetical protein